MKIQISLHSQSLKMTAKEEGAFRSNFGRPCSLWCIHLDPAQLHSECLHMDPAHRGDALGVYIWTQPSCSTNNPYQLPSQTVLKLAFEDPESLCVLLAVDHHLEQELHQMQHGCLHLDPAHCCIPHHQQKVKVLSESFKELDKISLYFNFFIQDLLSVLP